MQPPEASRTEAEPSPDPPRYRDVRYRYSEKMPEVLRHIGGTLAVTTYAAGKVALVSWVDDGHERGERDEPAEGDGGRMRLEFANFDRAMGLSAFASSKGRTLSIGTRDAVMTLQDVGPVAGGLPDDRDADVVMKLRTTRHTGDIAVHDVGHDASGRLWLVATTFSCLATLDDAHDFVPRWRPPFVTSLAAEDRCHLNGMAMGDDGPRFVTALGRTDRPKGWRAGKADGGVLIDVASGEQVAGGFCMPHSPRIDPSDPDRLWVLDSGRGRLVVVDRRTGRREDVEAYPGYGRGLAVVGRIGLVGISRARQTSVFGGVPIADEPAAMRCGVVAIDLVTGRSLAYLEFETGIEEIFEVVHLPFSTRLSLVGPHAATDGWGPIWVVPPV